MERIARADDFYLPTPPQKCQNSAYLGVSAAGAKFDSFLLNPPFRRGEHADDCAVINEPHYEKTCFLHMLKQKRRSATC